MGNLLLDVSATPAHPADRDLKALADGLRPKSDHAPYPIIAGFLPKAGMVEHSERYVLGRQAFSQAFPVGSASVRDWLGFDKSAEAIIAHYHFKGEPSDKEALVLIALYPTQQVAADEYNGFGKVAGVECRRRSCRRAARGIRQTVRPTGRPSSRRGFQPSCQRLSGPDSILLASDLGRTHARAPPTPTSAR